MKPYLIAALATLASLVPLTAISHYIGCTIQHRGYATKVPSYKRAIAPRSQHLRTQCGCMITTVTT